MSILTLFQFLFERLEKILTTENELNRYQQTNLNTTIKSLCHKDHNDVSKKSKKFTNPYKGDIFFFGNPSHPRAGRASAHHHFPPVQQQLPDVRTAKLSGYIVRAVVDFSVVDCSPPVVLSLSRKFFLRENATSHIRNRRSFG